jgi:hypothetical protein
MKKTIVILLAMIILSMAASAQGKSVGRQNTNVSGAYYKLAYVTDSVQIASSTSHAANTVLTNSTQNWLKFTGVAATNGGKFILENVQTNGDSLCKATIELILNNDTTKIAKIADNAQNVWASGGFNYRVAEIPFTLKGDAVGTGSTGTWDFVTGIDEIANCASTSKDIFGKLVAVTAYTPALNGYIRIKLKVWQEVVTP